MDPRKALHQPLVVGTLTGSGSLTASLARARAAQLDILEVRLDTFSASALRDTPRLLKTIKSSVHKPLLLTFRSSREGGAGRWSASQRAGALEAGLSQASWLDVEIRETALARRLTALARRKKVTVVHSLHDFSPGLRLPVYQKWGEASRRLGGDIWKVAVTPRDNGELERFLRWGKELKNPAKILIGMGRTGQPSRVIGFSFGSMATFGHLGVSAAPGQMPARELGRLVRGIYGR